MTRDCSISEFLRAVKRSPAPLVHHDSERCIWLIKTNKCLWICRLDNSLAGRLIDSSFELQLAKIPNVTFHHF